MSRQACPLGPHSGNVMAFAYQGPLKSNAALRNYMKLDPAVDPSHSNQNYSVVALFPIVMIGAVLFVICGAYRIKRWKLEKKQLAQLSLFYNIFETTKCNHNCSERYGHEEGCVKLRSALMIPPPRSTPFFQPPPAKGKKPRLEVSIHNASAGDIGYQLSKLLFNGDVTQAV